jgi:hypothetical protein
MKDDEHSVRLRFDSETFDKLDQKRHNSKTTFQAVGKGLFLRWLSGEEAPPSPLGALKPTKEEERLLANTLRYLRENPDPSVLRATLTAVGKWVESRTMRKARRS